MTAARLSRPRWQASPKLRYSFGAASERTLGHEGADSTRSHCRSRACPGLQSPASRGRQV